MIRARHKKHRARGDRLWYKALGRRNPVKTVGALAPKNRDASDRSRAAEGCQGMAFQSPSKGKFNPAMWHSQQNHRGGEKQPLRPLDQDLCPLDPKLPCMTERRESWGREEGKGQ